MQLQMNGLEKQPNPCIATAEADERDESSSNVKHGSSDKKAGGSRGAATSEQVAWVRRSDSDARAGRDRRASLLGCSAEFCAANGVDKD